MAELFSVSLDYLLRDAVPAAKSLRERAPGYAISTAENSTPSSRATFGEKLRHLRASRRLTQEVLARDLSLARQGYISSLEPGRRMPSLDLAAQIAAYFGVSLDYLLREDQAIEEGLPR